MSSNANPGVTWFALLGLMPLLGQVPSVASETKQSDASPVGQRLEVTLDRAGHLLVPGQKPLTTEEVMRAFLRQTVQDMKRRSEKDKAWTFAPTLVIRADRQARYKEVWSLLETAEKAGFKKTQLRVQTKGQ
jgi:biopolymer transport protein ExbD